jgi:hypothetical protein
MSASSKAHLEFKCTIEQRLAAYIDCDFRDPANRDRCWFCTGPLFRTLFIGVSQ